MESSAKELAGIIRRFTDVDVEWFNNNIYFRKPKEVGQSLGDLIIPGEGNLNIIDYMTPPGGDYSQMTTYINDVFERLQGAMCVIALQQWSQDQDHPAGGKGVLARPRFAVALLREPGTKRRFVKILKDKVSDDRNDGDIIYFNLNWQENRFEPAHPGNEPDFQPDAAPLSFEGVTYQRR